MIDEIQSAIKLINEQQRSDTRAIRRVLGLPEWFDTKTCILLIPADFKYLFKQEISWIRFSEYIPKDKMFALKNDIKYTGQGIAHYAS